MAKCVQCEMSLPGGKSKAFQACALGPCGHLIHRYCVSSNSYCPKCNTKIDVVVPLLVAKKQLELSMSLPEIARTEMLQDKMQEVSNACALKHDLYRETIQEIKNVKESSVESTAIRNSSNKYRDRRAQTLALRVKVTKSISLRIGREKQVRICPICFVEYDTTEEKLSHLETHTEKSERLYELVHILCSETVGMVKWDISWDSKNLYYVTKPMLLQRFEPKFVGIGASHENEETSKLLANIKLLDRIIEVHGFEPVSTAYAKIAKNQSSIDTAAKAAQATDMAKPNDPGRK